MKKRNILTALALVGLGLTVTAQTSTRKEEIKLKTTVIKNGVTTKIDTSFTSMDEMNAYLKASGIDIPQMDDEDIEAGAHEGKVRKVIRKEVETEENGEHSKDIRIEKRIIRTSSDEEAGSDEIDVQIDGDEIVIKDKINGKELERVKMEKGGTDVQVVVIKRTIEIEDLAPAERRKLGVEGAAKSFRISPNPAQGNLTIDLDEKAKGNVKLTIQGMDGRVLLEDEYDTIDTRFQVDIQDLSPGTYVVRLDQEGEISAKKLIISE